MTSALRMLITPTLVAILGTVLRPPDAHAQNLSCGIDCVERAYRSCNDTLALGSGPVSVSCSASLGSCSGQAFCASLGHAVPAGAFPIELFEILLVASDGSPSAAARPFQLRVYTESGTAEPGVQLGPTYDLSIQGSNSNAQRIDLASGFRPIVITSPGPFRVCLEKGFDAGHNVCLDPNQTTPGRNWAFVGIPTDLTDPCGSVVNSWYPAGGPFPNIQGDFIIRAKVRSANFSALPGAEDCGGADMGVGDSGSPPPPDASVPDEGVVTVMDVGLPSSPDAAQPAPTISAVSPSTADANIALDLVVRGESFQSGLAVNVGPRAAEGPVVFGTTTVRVSFAEGLPVGVHDVVVINPDGQAAIAPSAVIVGRASPDAGSDGTPEMEQDCTCSRSSSKAPARAAVLGFVFAALGIFRSRRRSRVLALPSAGRTGWPLPLRSDTL